MILRAYISCPACQRPVILRVGVAASRQTFSVACPNCQSMIRGGTAENESGFPYLDMPNIEVLDLPEDPEWPVVTVYGDLPIHPAGNPFSAFLSMHHYFGDDFEKYLKNVSQVRWFGERADSLDHAFRFYLDSKWDLLDSVMGRQFSPFWEDSPSEYDRHMLLHRMAYRSVIPLDPSGTYADAKLEVWSRSFKKESKFSECAHSVIAEPSFALLRRRVSQQYCGLMRSYTEWLPTLALAHLRALGKEISKDWQAPVGNFDVLRDAYRQNFELSCQALPLVIRMQNIAEGRDSQAIRIPGEAHGWAPRSPLPKDCVNNLNQFSKARAATKEAYLNRHPLLRKYWNSAYSRDVRNSIAHADFDYSMQDGIITYKDNESPYFEFVEALIKQIGLLVFWLDLCKLYVIYGSRWDPHKWKFLGLGN